AALDVFVPAIVTWAACLYGGSVRAPPPPLLPTSQARDRPPDRRAGESAQDLAGKQGSTMRIPDCWTSDNDLRLRGESFYYRAPIRCPQTEASDPAVVRGCLAMVGGRSRQVRLPAPPNVDATAT